METAPQKVQFRASDLPLSTAKRSAIDSLLHIFKKNGGFDSSRKRVWAEFVEDDAKTRFTTSLTDLAESELERDSSLLSRDRGKAATLIEGAVDRSGIYKSVELDVDAFISKHLEVVTRTLRELRKSEVGEEIAASEEKTGTKSDDEYAREAERRQQLRESQRLAELEEQRKLEKAKQRAKEAEEKEKLRQREMHREEELKREIEMLREREAQREKAVERDRAEQREKEMQREREREDKRLLERENKRLHHEDRQTARQRDESRHRKYQEHTERQWMHAGPVAELSPRAMAHNVKEETPEVKEVRIPPEEEKDWEQEALELLLKEGQEHAAKAQQRPELDRSESLEPPPRKGQSVKGARAESSPRKSPERSNGNTIKSMAPSPSLRPSSPAHNDPNPLRNQTKDRVRRHSRERDTARSQSRDHHHHRMRSTSRSRPCHTSRWGDERRQFYTESKDAYKKEVASKREREEADAYRRDQRHKREIITDPMDYNGRSTNRIETSARAHGDPRNRDPQRRDHNNNNRMPAITRHRSRSPSPRHSRRGRSRSRSPHRRNHRDRSRRRRHGSRSMSANGEGNYRHHHHHHLHKRGQNQSPPPRRRDRSLGQERSDRPRYADIDRYVPG
ncbi:MAG: hypothetical protein M1835_000319 [Candelina submexicana]|nr:MAG: hypothetical protein M1835_000319 [Candelina submexicana]